MEATTSSDLNHIMFRVFDSEPVKSYLQDLHMLQRSIEWFMKLVQTTFLCLDDGTVHDLIGDFTTLTE